MSTFTTKQVKRLGFLVRIGLTDEEADHLKNDLNVIADSISKIQELDTKDVPPTTNPVPLKAHLRDDTAATPLTLKEALSGAPKTSDGQFVAPRILGSE
jgi:aspartyl-tRNA(Asn)/glutamyl-tRNA(Gln) amidotransferase subunit C